MGKKKTEETVQEEESSAAEPESPAEQPRGKANTFPASVPVKKSNHGATVFQLVVIGDEGRVYGKTGTPVSPILPKNEATKLCSEFNVKDPEQVQARSRKADPKKNVLAERAATEERV